MTMTDVGQVISPTFVSLLLLVTAKIEQWGQIWSVSNLEIISLKKIIGLYNDLRLVVLYLSNCFCLIFVPNRFD